MPRAIFVEVCLQKSGLINKGVILIRTSSYILIIFALFVKRRFSSLFAELTDEIVPVAMENHMTIFHGTTATGWKGMDPFYFAMNPSPIYEVTFLNKLTTELTCSGGKSSHEVANYIQKIIASTLSYECTTLTRKDKYRALAGNDGAVASKPN